MLDSDESLPVTVVSPPIFGSQHWCRFQRGGFVLLIYQG